MVEAMNEVTAPVGMTHGQQLMQEGLQLLEDEKLLEQMRTYGAVTMAVGENAKARFPGCDAYLDYHYGRDTLQYAAVIGLVGQMLGYHIARIKGIDADSPRHLTQAIVLEK